VRWDGHPVGPDDRLPFGYMPEERGLHGQMRLRDQVRSVARLHRLAAADAERLGLAERGRDRVEAPSHGNQQRAQLAVALRTTRGS